MKINTINYSIREIIENVNKGHFLLRPSLNSPEITEEQFTFIISSILNDIFPKNYKLFSVEILGGLDSFNHSANLILKIIEFIESERFQELEPAMRAKFYRYSFDVNSILSSEKEGFVFLDKLFEIKHF